MRAFLAALLLCLLTGAASAESGIASVYTIKSNGGNHKTASGRPLNESALTAAHKTLPFGTMVRVTNQRNGRSVIVTISDRGPYIRGRVIDLTMAGARAIGMGYGLAPVKLELVGCKSPRINAHSLAGC
jgi:rare lipoprotein A